jgi:predicted phage replisome organizer
LADDWFKLNMDLFGNRKIKYIRRLPNGDSIALFWIALLAEARRCNSDGRIFLTERIPYTQDLLAEEFQFEEKTVKSALDAFNQLDMISTIDGFITITGWEDHQNTEGLAKIREQTRKRVAKHREKQSALQCNATVTLCNAADIEEDKDKDLDKEKKIDCQQIADMYNSICISFPKLRSLSDARRKAIKARLNTYTEDDFRTVFENAEASSFLKGSNDRNWTATFDWMIKDTNMVKILEGNYADKGKPSGRKEKLPGWFNKGFEMGDAELAALNKMMNDDPDAQKEREQLERELQAFGRK